MDPVTAAGIGLSVTSLALQVFSGCIKGYQIYIDAVDVPEKLRYLKLRMQLEQTRLLNWGEKVGFLEETVEKLNINPCANQLIVIDTLLAIKNLLQKGALAEEDVDGQAFMTITNTRPPPSQPAQKRTKALLTKALQIFEKAGQVPARLSWAVLKQDRFEHLVERLISYNDSIVSFLDRAVIDRLFEMQQSSQLIMLQMSSKLDELERLSRAVHFMAPKTEDIVLGLENTATDMSFAGLVSFKVNQTSIELESSTENMQPLDRISVQLASDNRTRTQATYKETQQVWVEWKELGEDETDNPAFSEAILSASRSSLHYSAWKTSRQNLEFHNV